MREDCSEKNYRCPCLARDKMVRGEEPEKGNVNKSFSVVRSVTWTFYKNPEKNAGWQEQTANPPVHSDMAME